MRHFPELADRSPVAQRHRNTEHIRLPFIRYSYYRITHEDNQLQGQ